MDDNEQTPDDQTDLIDIELSKLLDSLIDEDEESDDAFEEAEGVLFDVIGNLVDDEQIPEIPDPEADEETKQAWLSQALPLIQADLKAALEEED